MADDLLALGPCGVLDQPGPRQGWPGSTSSGATAKSCTTIAAGRGSRCSAIWRSAAESTLVQPQSVRAVSQAKRPAARQPKSPASAPFADPTIPFLPNFAALTAWSPPPPLGVPQCLWERRGQVNSSTNSARSRNGGKQPTSVRILVALLAPCPVVAPVSHDPVDQFFLHPRRASATASSDLSCARGPMPTLRRPRHGIVSMARHVQRSRRAGEPAGSLLRPSGSHRRGAAPSSAGAVDPIPASGRTGRPLHSIGAPCQKRRR